MNGTCSRSNSAVIPVMLLIASALLLLYGCASIVGYERLYDGDPKPITRIALLTHPNPYSQVLLIFKIDGQKAFLPGVAELTPGRHTVTSSFAASKGSTVQSSKGAVDLQFTAEAGHVYVIYPVIYTHQNRWYPEVRDITGELRSPQQAELVGKIDAILLKNRGASSASVASLAPSGDPGMVKGFGEKITASLKPWTGKDLAVTYPFDRYKPYLTAKAADKGEYHLQIDPLTGRVVNVFGRTIDVGGTMQMIDAFQPTGSIYAYNWVPPAEKYDEQVSRIYEEQKNGTFRLIEKRHWAKYNDQYYSALVPVALTEGLPDEAVYAMALAFNTKFSVLADNLRVKKEIKGLSKENAAFRLESKAIMLGREARNRLAAVMADARADTQPRIRKALTDCDRIVQANLFGNPPPLAYNDIHVRFFQTGYEMCPKSQRKYQSILPAAATTFVGWELDLTLPPPGKRIDYQIKAFWFKPDGTLLTHQTADAYCEADWTGPWRAEAWGYKEPGNWQPGTYAVEFYINGKKAAVERFTIQ